MRKLMIIITFCFLFFCTSCASKTPINNLNVQTVNDEETLKKLIKSSTDNYQFGGLEEAPLDNDAIQADAGAEKNLVPAPEHSETNSQVEGVEEGDIIKTDGNYIYIASFRSFMVCKVSDGNIEPYYRDDFVVDQNYRYSTMAAGLYITDRYAIVIGHTYVSRNYFGVYYSGEVNIRIYDITSDPITMVKEIYVSGHYVDSRLIDDRLYVVSNYTVYETTPFEALRPFLDDNGVRTVPAYSDIKYVEGMQSNTYSIFTTITLGEEIEPVLDTFLGAHWGEFYVSQNSFYVASWHYKNDEHGYFSTTDLVRYKINQETGHIELRGFINLPGSIVNQFSMDEYDGYFRIVTTSDRWYYEVYPYWDPATGQIIADNGSTRMVKNHLFVLQIDEFDETGFQQVGYLSEGLGKPLESVKSVRFDKEEASIVTFQQTDPLYLIDLNDPANPVIKGSLEIPGFSTYQHLWDESTLVGIGYNTVDGRTTGLKISLFDRTNPEAPAELAKIEINGYSEALYNHKAILIDKVHNIIGLSVGRYVNISESTYYGYYIEEYYLIKIDRNSEEPLKIVGVITHDLEQDTSSPYTSYYCAYLDIKRVVMVGDYYYAISGGKVTSHTFTENGLTLVNELKINTYISDRYWIMADDMVVID